VKLGDLFVAVGLKRPALKLYFLIRNNLVGAKFGIRRIILPRLVHFRQKNGILAVDIRNDYGIGAKIAWCIEIFKYCEVEGLVPQIRFSYPGGHNDYFSSYFSIRAPGPVSQKAIFTSFHFLHELGFSENYSAKLTLTEGSRLFQKYLGVNELIGEEVDEFCRQHFAGKAVIGIHFRGTDKTGEAPEVPYEKARRNIEFAIKQIGRADAVFLSTDDQHFADYLVNNMGQLPVIMRNDYKRSNDKQAVHLDKGLDKYEVNRDAVVNMLLLAKCDFLIKSSSALSDISKLINPKLPVVMLNRPYDGLIWFPAKEILKDMAFEPVQ